MQDKTANIAEAKAAGGDEAGASPPAAADGDEDKRGIVVENPLVNAFMVSPFQIKTQDDDDEDDGLKSGKKSAKSAKGKGPKSGKGDKSAKGKGKQSGRKEADGEEKKDDAKAEPVIDRIDLFDLASEYDALCLHTRLLARPFLPIPNHLNNGTRTQAKQPLS